MDVEKLEERIAKLTKGMAKINVGGSNQTEIEELMHSVEDAVNATKCALRGGIVKGSGLALYEVNLGNSEAELIISEVIKKPLETILNNAGVELRIISELHGSTINETNMSVYDVITQKIVDPFEAGIIDPALAPITAIRNAVAVTGTFITMNSMTLKNLDK